MLKTALQFPNLRRKCGKFDHRTGWPKGPATPLLQHGGPPWILCPKTNAANTHTDTV